MVALPDCTVGPKRITSPEFDVRAVAPGPEDSFVISAIHQGRERIYRVSPGTELQLLAEGDEPMTTPVISPDGEMLVVRKRVSYRWQLASLDLSSRAWKQLTYGDCNAYAPSWQDDHTLLYATDCMRGMGLTTLASLKIAR